jgi:hypothetical protein
MRLAQRGFEARTPIETVEPNEEGSSDSWRSAGSQARITLHTNVRGASVGCRQPVFVSQPSRLVLGFPAQLPAAPASALRIPLRNSRVLTRRSRRLQHFSTRTASPAPSAGARPATGETVASWFRQKRGLTRAASRASAIHPGRDSRPRLSAPATASVPLVTPILVNRLVN